MKKSVKSKGKGKPRTKSIDASKLVSMLREGSRSGSEILAEERVFLVKDRRSGFTVVCDESYLPETVYEMMLYGRRLRDVDDDEELSLQGAEAALEKEVLVALMCTTSGECFSAMALGGGSDGENTAHSFSGAFMIWYEPAITYVSAEPIAFKISWNEGEHAV